MTRSRFLSGRLCKVALVMILLGVATVFTWARLLPVAAATPSGGDPVAYVAAGQGVAVIDALTNVAVRAPIPLVSCPVDIAITPDARFALVVTRGTACGGSPAPSGPQLVMIDTASNTLSLSASLPGDPLSLAITPDGGTAFVVIPAQPSFTNQQPSPGGGVILPVAIGAGPSLTLRNGFSPSTGSSPLDVAVSPDASKLYVLTSDGCDGGCLDRMTLSGAGDGPAIRVLANHSLVLSPDGAKAFISRNIQCSECPAGLVEAVDLATRAVSQVDLSSAGLRPNPLALAIGTTPDGTSTLYAGMGGSNSLLPIPLSTLVASAPIPLETIPHALAALPDGSRLEVTTERGFVASVAAPGGPQTPCFAKPGCPPGNGALAITPDQRPVAALSAVAHAPGQATAFDASASTIAYRGITSYAWNFGDGQSALTPGPATTHAYGAAGTFTVVLTETDSAGASTATVPPSTIFTGHTMTRRGGPPAQTSVRVTIAAVPVSPTPPASPSPSPSTPPAGQPRLSIFPQVGPPGTVVLASGSGFPAHTAIMLAWAPGVGITPVTSDNGGSFKAFVLVLPHDQMGPRKLVPRGYPVSAAFLVVPISLAPGGADNQVVFRR